MTPATRVDAGVRVGAVAVLIAGLALVVWWWASGGGLSDLSGWESGLMSTGRVTGLVAADLLLVQVVLMARVPALERAYGQDSLARMHRIVGFTSFDLMVAHIVLITWGYAAGRITDTPATLWDLTWNYPAMLLALGGTLCLILAVGASIRAARRRLRYESWHLLHLYAYLGVGLALPHQLWTGQEFLASTAATVYWWTVWAVAALAVLVWRIAVPLVRTLRHSLRVTSVVREADGIVSVYLTGRDLKGLGAEAGHFFTWRFLGSPGWTRAHPYSLSAAPDGRSLRITVKDLGDGSRALHKIHPGTRVLIEGPYGRLGSRARTRRKVVMIGAGVGVTPLRALVEGLDYEPGEAVLLQRYTDRPLFDRELDLIASERGLRVAYLPGRRRDGASWLGTSPTDPDDATALLELVPDIAERDVFVCGPDGWMAAVRNAARRAGVPARHIHTEAFGW